MRRIRTLGRGGRVLVALAVGGALFGIATAVQADIPDSGTINACYYTPGKLPPANPRKGALRVIDKSKGQTCGADETALTWNAKGVSGATGPTGATGPSHAYTDYSGAHSLVGGGGTGTLASVTLPVGHFTLSGEVVFGSAVPPNETSMSCTFASSGTVHELGAEATGVLVDMTVLADVDVTSPGTAVDLRCSDTGDWSVGAGGAIIATQVGATN